MESRGKPQVIRLKQTSERDDGDEARDRVACEAPVADGVDHRELDDEQVAAEAGRGQRERGDRRPCARVASSRERPHDEIPTSPSAATGTPRSWEYSEL